jgi:hypothetical protein
MAHRSEILLHEADVGVLSPNGEQRRRSADNLVVALLSSALFALAFDAERVMAL